MKLGQHAHPKAADIHRADPINTNGSAVVLTNTELLSSVLCVLVAALKIEIEAVGENAWGFSKDWSGADRVAKGGK